MKNEIFQQFRKYQQISEIFKPRKNMQIDIFLVFSENFWTFREMLGKLHQQYDEKLEHSEILLKSSEINNFFN